MTERPVEDAPGAAPPVPLNRMVIALLALGGMFISVYLLLYDVGALPAVACGAGSCERVQNSPWAVFLGLPVPLWGVAGYTFLFVLALMGIQHAVARERKIAVGLLGGATLAFLFSMYLTWIEAFVISAWCRWCIASAVLATLLFLCSLAELPRVRRTYG